MDELTREFLIESQEGLDRMERCLTDLEEKPGDSDLLADIFRSVHTIKGTTGFLGYKRLEKLAHAGENLLGMLRDGSLTADRKIISALLGLLDRLRAILKDIEDHDEDGDVEADQDLIAILRDLQQPGKAPVAAPKPKRARAARKKSTPVAIQIMFAAPEPPKPQAAPQRLAEAKPAAKSETKSEPKPEPKSAAKPEAKDSTRPKIRAGDNHASAAESTLRVDITLLNRMMNLVGELVLTRNQILQVTASDPNMTMLTRRLDKVTADLRESVMVSRMQPVSNIFSKVPRLVRDLSEALGKRVRLQVEGQDTGLDKSLLEAIKDPLTHVVRNALDHGIETPAVREAAGKNPEGVLRLKALQQGSHVVVEVSDDGNGISVERIRKKAIERGLITKERADALTERELLQLIFLPGFSTAVEVTNVSGRGVGMDVVRTNVEKIGGTVEIDSHAGVGTTMRLRIPLTLAIVPALIVRSMGQSFAVPQAALTELVHVPGESASRLIEWMENAALYRLRGKLLPLVFLDRLLGANVDKDSAPKVDRFIAVLDVDGLRYGLVVEGLADPEEVVVKPLSAVLKEIGVYSGATVLGNGSLALILDPGAMASRAGVRAVKDAKEEEAETAAEEAGARQDFLVVDIVGRPAAVPLEKVVRIEQMPLARVEFAGSRRVLQINGELLPLEDPGGVLDGSAGIDPVPVVICQEGNRNVGIAVSRVIDVASGEDLFEAGTRTRSPGMMLVRDRVTGLVDLEGVPPLTDEMPAMITRTGGSE